MHRCQVTPQFGGMVNPAKGEGGKELLWYGEEGHPLQLREGSQQEVMPSLNTAGRADGDLLLHEALVCLMQTWHFEKKCCGAGTWPDLSISEDWHLAPESSWHDEVVWDRSWRVYFLSSDTWTS